MAYAQIAKGLGRVLGKRFLRNLGGKKAVKEIAQESLLSGAANFGLGIGGQVMTGQPIDVGQDCELVAHVLAQQRLAHCLVEQERPQWMEHCPTWESEH